MIERQSSDEGRFHKENLHLLTVNCNEAAPVLADLRLWNFQSDGLVEQRPAVLVDEVFEAVRIRVSGETFHGVDKVGVLEFLNRFDEAQFELVLVQPLEAGQVELKRWVGRFLLANHDVLEPVAF